MALGSSTFSNAGGAVSDLFAAQAHRLKAKGDIFEKQNYDLAATFADQNVQYTEAATRIKAAQADRELNKSIGGIEESVGSAGFGMSGSALDIMRDSASQGALTHQVLVEQGQISEAGYQEQAQSYRNMSSAASVAIDAENKAATGATWTAALKGAAALASLA